MSEQRLTHETPVLSKPLGQVGLKGSPTDTVIRRHFAAATSGTKLGSSSTRSRGNTMQCTSVALMKVFYEDEEERSRFGMWLS